MFFKLFEIFGWIDQGHKRAAVAARQAFSTAHPSDAVAWTEIGEEQPDRFLVYVYYGRQRPKQRRAYTVDRDTFKALEIADPERSGNGHSGQSSPP